jgi:hypothetical protein
LIIEKSTKKKEKETYFDKQINYFGIKKLKNIESKRDGEREMIGNLNRNSLALVVAVIRNSIACRGVTSTCDVVFGVGVNLGTTPWAGAACIGTDCSCSRSSTLRPPPPSP